MRRSVKANESRSRRDRKSTRLNYSHPSISYAVFCLKKKCFAGMDRSLSQKRLLHRIMGIFKTSGTAAVEIEPGEHFFFFENHCGASARRNYVVNHYMF